MHLSVLSEAIKPKQLILRFWRSLAYENLGPITRSNRVPVDHRELTLAGQSQSQIADTGNNLCEYFNVLAGGIIIRRPNNSGVLHINDRWYYRLSNKDAGSPNTARGKRKQMGLRAGRQTRLVWFVMDFPSDKQQILDRYLDDQLNKLRMQHDVDWRPQEMTPEDFYA